MQDFISLLIRQSILLCKVCKVVINLDLLVVLGRCWRLFISVLLLVLSCFLQPHLLLHFLLPIQARKFLFLLLLMVPLLLRDVSQDLIALNDDVKEEKDYKDELANESEVPPKSFIQIALNIVHPDLR